MVITVHFLSATVGFVLCHIIMSSLKNVYTPPPPADLALCSSSSLSGMPLWTKIPRFIFAGSRAQLEIPMKATFLCGAGVSSP